MLGLFFFLSGGILLLHCIYRSNELTNALTLLLLAVVGLSFGLWFFQIADHINGAPRQIHYMAQYYAMKTYYKNRLIEGCIQKQTLQRYKRHPQDPEIPRTSECDVTDAEIALTPDDMNKGPDIMSEKVQKYTWAHGDKEYPEGKHNLDMRWMECEPDVSERFGNTVRRFTRREMELAIKISEVRLSPILFSGFCV